MKKPSRPHDEWLSEQLKDPEFAAEFVSAAAADVPAVYLSALRRVVESRGMAKVARAAGIPRESLYRALSPTGNPRLSTLTAVLRAAGLQLSAGIAQKKSGRRRSATV